MSSPVAFYSSRDSRAVHRPESRYLSPTKVCMYNLANSYSQSGLGQVRRMVVYHINYDQRGVVHTSRNTHFLLALALPSRY